MKSEPPLKVKGSKRAAILLLMGQNAYAYNAFKLLTIYNKMPILFIETIKEPGIFYRAHLYENGRTKPILAVKASLLGIGLAGKVFSYILSYLGLLFLILIARRRTGLSDFKLCIADSYVRGSVALLLKSLKIIKGVIYWADDYLALSQYDNLVSAIINKTIFPILDLFCFWLADACWDLTPAIRAARMRYWRRRRLGKLLRFRASVVVPPPLLEKGESNLVFFPPRSIVFIGYPRNDHLFNVTLSSLSELNRQGFKLYLEIIGPLDNSKNLRELAKQLGIEQYVIFHGFMDPKDQDISKILSKSLVGLALFSRESFSVFTFPSKVIHYLENGIPVITTPGYIGRIISDNRIGFVVNPTTYELVVTIRNLLLNSQLYQELKGSVRKFLTSIGYSYVRTFVAEVQRWVTREAGMRMRNSGRTKAT